jgi:hypothetical protein
MRAQDEEAFWPHLAEDLWIGQVKSAALEARRIDAQFCGT